MTPTVRVGQVLTAWQWSDCYDRLAAGVQVVALIGYTVGVIRLRRQGHAWSPRRSASFAAGTFVLAIAVESGLASYDDSVFVVHVLQHLLLMMVAPPLIACGAPLTLAIRNLRGRRRAALVHVLHHRALRVASALLVSSLVYYAAMYIDFSSPVYRYTLTHELAHNVSHVVMFTAGCVFWWPMLSPDPIRHRPTVDARRTAMLAGLPLELLLGALIAWHPAGLRSLYAAVDLRDGGTVFASTAALTCAAGLVVMRAQQTAGRKMRSRYASCTTHRGALHRAAVRKRDGSCAPGTIGAVKAANKLGGGT